MQRTITKTKSENPRQILTMLLEQPVQTPATISPSTALVPAAATAQRIARLERQAPQIVKDAESAGVEIDYLGTHLLFNETRLYAGVHNDWVLGPAREANDAVVPKRERQTLQRLAASSVIDMPALYVAHEVPKERTKDLVVLGDGPVAVDRVTATDLVGPVPEPKESVALGETLGQRAQQAMHAAGQAARLAGMTALAVAVAPVAAVAGLAATVDPIILGAIPAGASSVGEPAAWFVLVKWDW